MKIKDGETFEAWAERVRMFERGHAYKALANDVDIDTVMDAMSKRIMNKLLHYAILQLQVPINYNNELSRQEYFKIMETKSRGADHVNWD
jgi:hypothetical protein